MLLRQLCMYVQRIETSKEDSLSIKDSLFRSSTLVGFSLLISALTSQQTRDAAVIRF